MIKFIGVLCILLGLIGATIIAVFLWNKRPTDASLRSVTKLIFVTTQISALVWVFISYVIAIYSTVCLGQVYTMSELSTPAIHTILGVSFLKVLENIFEHNEGGLFGRSKDGNS